MRICHIIEAAGGGSGQVVMDLARFGVESGDDVTVIYSPQRAWPGFVSTLAQIPEIKLVPSPMQRKVGAHDLVDAVHLYRTLKRIGPFDVIHSHSSKAGALTRLVGIFLPASAKVYTPHGFITLAPEASPFYRWIERALSFLCSRVITVSENEKLHARTLGIPEKKIALISNGITPQPALPREQARHELGLDPHVKVLGFIGRLVKQKNPLLALRAFFLAASKNPDLHLAIIGDGALMPLLEKALENNRFSRQVHLLGPREGGRFIAAFDAFLCSSDYEGMPIVFLESLAAGVPILSTPVGGVEEAIREGQTGFVAQGHTAEALADIISQFCALTLEQRVAMHFAAQRHVQNFSLHQMGKDTRRLYEHLIAHKRLVARNDEARPLRICHVVEATAGGSARIVSQLIRGSIAAGDEVTLIYSPQRADAPFLKAIDEMKELRRVGLPMERNISSRDFIDGFKLYQLLKKMGPFDVIHSHSSKAGALARIVGLFFPRAAKIYTPHGFFALTPEASRIYGWIEWMLSWLSDGIVTVSQREKRLAQERMHIPERKLNLILNGVELDYPINRAEARNKLGYKDDDYVVGFVGRLVEIKNPMRLIETFRLLAQHNPRMKLAIVGQGNLKAEMDIKINAYGLMNKVQFIDNQDARDLIPGFDCLLCTSDAESFGLVLIESLYAGVPVVTTPVGISDSAILPGITGYIGGFTPESLADGVLQFAALSPERREQVGVECARVARQFDVNAMLMNTHSLYHSFPQRKRRKA